MTTLFYEMEVAEADGDAVDLFAGPGGWTKALEALGRPSDIGLEVDRWACATRRAAGFHAIECNVEHVDPADFSGARGLIASPPCQAFSSAGKQHGRQHLDEILAAIRSGDWKARPSTDPNVYLVLDVGRWAEVLDPEWIALEQVPAVLPAWHAYAEWLDARGYYTWTGILNAADFGVPQIRKRAFLMARRSKPIGPPAPTHSKTGEDGLERWVTMAEALGWTGLLSTGRDWREDGTSQSFDAELGPAPALTAKSGGQWHRGETNRDLPSWPADRPSTTIAGDPRAFHPGSHIAHDGRDLSKAIGRSEGTIMLSIEEALILQSFPPDYPVRGTKTEQFIQIGNAVPPKLAEAVLREIFDS